MQFINAAVLDAALAYIKDNATELRLIRNYAFGDSLATVQANTLVTIALSPTDFTLGAGASNGRKFTLAAKSGTATAVSTGSAGGHDHHWAICSATEVLKVHDETGNAPVEIGNSVNSPVLECTLAQPTVV